MIGMVGARAVTGWAVALRMNNQLRHGRIRGTVVGIADH
jgi:hypothetical protein